ncbi:EF-P 5-aminopentanol modification-associated protein YfmF [Staphylococcus intermedius]|uniref:Peptidase, M16 family n=1 Tax=Staphylococcus intermedius NCTC 11048 TaxID=1141106 RepID=A0A380G9E7_STAIN|nr:pitrilysin family protein [Staphylococcus intermedius]PCF65044.1 peptidase M16 [Staphylococcus intermedius]PCF80655.1 peptidase M16 [Staphylococcus intermedius]PCF82004.1 peptidase M16 [Staphylococcus intermedius]PCF88340.1 peptidase M16 [Staphylococcus intermedius]PCF89055.1 peptidase M16 [Staphylococcus intermedius]
MKQLQEHPDQRITVLSTNKFKTTTMIFKFMAPLDKKTMTQRSLLSKLLVRATQQYPTDKAFNQYLSELYGAYVNSYVSKYKDRHVISVTLEIVNERYLLDDEPLFDKGIALLKEVILNPLVRNGAFDETFVDQEKSLLKKKLTAIEDNKSQIAYLRLLRHMFGEHPYSYMAAGDLGEIDSITATDLYHTYRSMLDNDYCSVYVVGNVEEAATIQHIQSEFNIQPFTYQVTQFGQHIQHDAPVNEVIEQDNVDQAKLNMGFRFPTQYGDKDFYALLVFNMMFGGDPSSVLFNEVREQKSLAYSIHSQIDGKNGFLFVMSGVSAKDYELAKVTIIEAFNRFKAGEFSDDKMELAKKIILSGRKESKDRPKNMIEMMHNQLLLEIPETDAQYEARIKAVKHEDIQRLCQNAHLDTIYILTKEDDTNE